MNEIPAAVLAAIKKIDRKSYSIEDDGRKYKRISKGTWRTIRDHILGSATISSAPPLPERAGPTRVTYGPGGNFHSVGPG